MKNESIKLEDVQDDIEVVLMTGSMLGYEVEFYEDDVYTEKDIYYYFKKDLKYLFTINLTLVDDCIEQFCICKKGVYLYRFQSNKINKEEIIQSLHDFLPKLTKNKKTT